MFWMICVSGFLARIRSFVCVSAWVRYLLHWAVYTMKNIIIVGVILLGAIFFMTNSNQGSREIVPGLLVSAETEGTGAEAVNGKTAVVHYKGTLANGMKFDSSHDRGQPFSFTLGAGQVIRGWDLGVVGMKVGGMRTLVISPELAYGSQGAGAVIPPNATLTFVVELLGVE